MNNTSRKRSTRPHRKKSTIPKTPYGYCHCGCGRKTRLAPYTSKPRLGWIKGQPTRYINGHQSTKPRPNSRIIIVKGSRCRTVPLTRGKEAIVKIKDYEKVADIVWSARKADNGEYYAISTPSGGGVIAMHRLIMNASPLEEVDHINGNGLDNRNPENLRIATRHQNSFNRKPNRGRTFKGVAFRYGRFRASIGHNYRTHHLGVFDTAEEAARAYNKAAKDFYGMYARLNPVEDTGASA